MGERKLNFSAPLMSVRRFSSPIPSEDRRNRKIIENYPPTRQLALLFNRSELDLDQVTEPVAVPFHWEQIPGRAKNVHGPQPQPPDEASTTPRLPPGRSLDILKQPSEKECKDTKRFSFKIEAYPSNDNLIKLESYKEGINEKGCSDLEDGSDVYSDALETLSPTDSFSMNYSASGLSGSDGPDVKPSGTFSTDPETRDFMMSRFLPAAKAMALEPHRYASRKQDMLPEQPREVKRVVSEDRRTLLNQNKLDIIPLYGQNKDEEESEDEEDDHDNSGNNSAKGCGLFPSLRLKNSLCLLSPVPGIRVRTQGSASSTHDTVRPGKTAYSRSLTQTTQKHAWGAVHDSKLDYGVRPAELQKVDKKQTGESSRFTCSGELQKVDKKQTGESSRFTRSGELHKVDNKQTGESSRFTRSGELQKVDKKQTGESSRFTRSGELQTIGRFSPYRGSGGAGVSPYRNKASQSPFRGARFLGVPKEVENIKANKFNLYIDGTNKNKQGSGSMSPAVEKTLYVDTVNTAEISLSNSRSLETKGWIYSSGEDLETSLEGKMFEETTNAESVFQDIKCLNISTEGDILESFVSVDADLSSMSEISHLKGQDVMMDGSGQDQGLDKRSRSLECSKPITEGNLNIDSDQIHRADDPGNADSSSVNSPLPPALPKSPSESWLWRTLPSISSRNLFSHSNLGTHKHLKKHTPKTSSTNIKWETIVKTSHLRHDHVRFSEELITHVSQQSKT